MYSKPHSIHTILSQRVAQFTEEVITLLNDDNLEETIERIQHLAKAISKTWPHDETTLNAQLVFANKEYRNGLIDYSIYRRERTRITQALLDQLKTLPKDLNRLISSTGNIRTVFLQTLRTDAEEVDLEYITGDSNPIMQIAFLIKALIAANSICRIVRPDGKVGIGFLAKEGYVFTNHRILENAVIVEGTKIEFNYEQGEDNDAKKAIVYELDALDFLYDEELDVVRVKVKASDNSLNIWGTLQINTKYETVINDRIYKLGHTEDNNVKIVLSVDEVINNDREHSLFHSMNTKSSVFGGPVFNKKWEVIALHHSGKHIEEGGLQINIQGESVSANQSTYFKKIQHRLDELIQQSGAIPPKIPSGNKSKGSSNTKSFFLMYDNEDRNQVAALKKHLEVLRRSGRITLFDMHQFSAGGASEQIEDELQKADYVLAILTYNFMFSTFDLAQRAKTLNKIIIPLLINDTFLDGTFLNELKKLPTTGVAVEHWDSQDSAYVDIVKQLHLLIMRP